ncbi:lasso peptide isopeptide bond-forming cyclase [soil metagenome]
MSGICGIVNLDGSPVDIKTVHKMAQAAAHRGPDGIRYHTEDGTGFAHLALNITPESVHEKQPLQSREGDLLLTADARIDNREELIRLLTSKNHLREETPTDADLILAAYRCWGEDSSSHLIGDFAFAIWDVKRRRLFAARDAMGMRALYYRVESKRVLFGTEVKQILAVPGVPARIFEPAVGAHLAGPYGKPEWSFYEGISQLSPAHALVVDQRGQRIWRYWDIDPDQRIEYSTEEEYVEHFFEVFRESVRCRLRSTKPVGVFLSGGMDSGSIASTAGWMLQQKGENALPVFRAYCWAFDELPIGDERHVSNVIAHRYGFPVTEVAADEIWPLRDYPEYGPDRDDPLAWVYQPLVERTLATAQAEGMGVMLSGDRGDEMVGDWVFDLPGLLWAGKWRTLWSELQAYRGWNGEPMSQAMTRRLLKPLLLNAWPSGTERVLNMRRKLRSSESSPYPNWVRPEFAERIGLAEIIKESRPNPPLTNHARHMRYGRIFSFGPSRLLLLYERLRARFGQGFADPWSDRRLAEFVLAVPQWRVQRVGESKRIARQAMRGVMPEQARREAGKIEPVSLFDLGFKERARDTVLDLITDTQAADRGYLDERVLHNYYGSLLRDEPPHYDFWWPLTLEMWLRQHWS